MQFNSLKDAFNFYTSYLMKGGFGVCKHSTNFHKITKELCSQAFMCSKGYFRENGYRIHGDEECKISNDYVVFLFFRIHLVFTFVLLFFFFFVASE